MNSVRTGQKVLINTGFLSFGRIVTIATGVVWTAIIARYIGPVVYGTYGYLLSILAILVLFINFGFEYLTTRDVAQRPELGWSYLFSILYIKLILSVVLLGGFMAFVFWKEGKEDVAGIAIWTAIITFLGALLSLTSSILYGREAMGYDTIAKVLRSFLALASAYICVQMRLNFTTILAVFAATSAFQLFLASYFVGKVLHVFPIPRTSFQRMGTFSKDLLSRSLPFLVLMIVGVFYNSIPTILVKNLSFDPAEVGYYAAAHRIFFVLNIMPSMLFQAILPAFSRLYVENLEKMRKIFKLGYRFVILLACPMAFGLWLVAPRVIHLIYGADFEGGGQVLKILAVSLINGVGWVMTGALIAMDRQRVIVLISGVGVVLMSVIAWWSIPIWGAVAGAWAYTSGTLLGFVVYSALTYRLLRIR
jgi:PST family polysaccharide transporter